MPNFNYSFCLIEEILTINNFGGYFWAERNPVTSHLGVNFTNIANVTSEIYFSCLNKFKYQFPNYYFVSLGNY